VISGTGAGGIAGYKFAYDTTSNSVISECYNTGVISGTRAGGIVGADLGFNDNAIYTPIVDISLVVLRT